MVVDAEKQFHGVEETSRIAERLLHNTASEANMLYTHLLGKGELLRVIKRLSDTVARMTNHMADLEASVLVCRKRLADMTEGGTGAD
eukprot:CAMPEP_0117513078 /NCGR_PEP_ID=MMETSP0784-20121206/29363_1 /TAXON_ID=39447 /ORGANISM="" /LENGTH=86 /DNA_ID=CAMNT_0005308821 /DNA_START=307 /DNA_END=564 /DNA_ORIENTATION=-